MSATATCRSTRPDGSGEPGPSAACTHAQSAIQGRQVHAIPAAGPMRRGGHRRRAASPRPARRQAPRQAARRHATRRRQANSRGRGEHALRQGDQDDAQRRPHPCARAASRPDQEQQPGGATSPVGHHASCASWKASGARSEKPQQMSMRTWLGAGGGDPDAEEEAPSPRPGSRSPRRGRSARPAGRRTRCDADAVAVRRARPASRIAGRTHEGRKDRGRRHRAVDHPLASRRPGRQQRPSGVRPAEPRQAGPSLGAPRPAPRSRGDVEEGTA
jgi:hypothetical protein